MSPYPLARLIAGVQPPELTTGAVPVTAIASSLALSLAVMTPAKLVVAAGKVTPVPVELLIGTAVGVTTPKVKFVKLKLFSLVLSVALMVPEELVVAALIERIGVGPLVSSNKGAEATS